MFRCLVLSLGLIAGPLAAQERQSHCIAIADAAPGIAYLHQAKWGDALDDYQVRLTYLDHSMFLIEAPDGTTAVTDYNGWLPIPVLPDVVTMNHAHSSHWTRFPDPGIGEVLEGWGDGESPNLHREEIGEMFVRNVPTDIRSGYSGVEKYGNSIFVFEVAGLCIGHLGHLHHEPDEAQYAALGRLDVVMAAVDGGMTVDLPTMIRVVNRLKSSVVIPMHWFGRATLQRFLTGISEEFMVNVRESSSYEVSLRSLPDRPTVMVLPPLSGERR